MNALTNFAYGDHLVRAVEIDGEPWFVGKDICAALDISKYRDALSTLDDDEGRPVLVDTLGGKQEMFGVSEPGVYRLVFRSRKPEAEKFKRWLAHEVLPAIRRTGSYGTQRTEIPALDQDAPLMARVEAVKTAARLWGRAQARTLWASLGLPAMPEVPQTVPDTAPEDCLRHLLEHEPGRQSISAMLLDAAVMRSDVMLRPLGIRLAIDQTGFVVASSHPALAEIYAGSRWHGGGWSRALRTLSGASTTGTMRYAQDLPVSRGTFIPFGHINPSLHSPAHGSA